MRVLVTGGAGFIGSHLCKFLLEKNRDEVICLDNFFTGKKQNLESIANNPNFKIISHDITDTDTRIDSKIPEHVDKIYNLACPASPVHYQFDPIETVLANTQGVINVLKFARLNNATVLQASTSEIYGDPLEHPQKETYRGNVNTLGPRACYDEGKRVAETLFMDYHRKFKLPIRIARIFNTYGPNMDKDDGRVVSNFIIQALTNQKITIYGKGTPTRSFCYVDDLVCGLILLMDSPADVKGPINLGNPDTEMSMLELAKEIIKFTKSESKIIFEDLPKDDPERRCPDITLAKKVFKWKPSVKHKVGIRKTVEYFKNI